MQAEAVKQDNGTMPGTCICLEGRQDSMGDRLGGAKPSQLTSSIPHPHL